MNRLGRILTLGLEKKQSRINGPAEVCSPLKYQSRSYPSAFTVLRFVSIPMFA